MIYTYRHVRIKILNCFGFHFDSLQPLSLELGCRLDRVHHLTLEHRNQRAGADERVRAGGHEVVGEAIDANSEISLLLRAPLLLQLDSPLSVNWEGVV